jgi:hypothetical protein
MKTPVILLSASFALAVLTAGVAAAASAKDANSAQTAANTMSYSDAMYQCATNYAGPRGNLGKDRGMYIEMCFKNLTGKNFYEVGQKCPLRRC